MPRNSSENGQKTVPGRVRVNFAQTGATEKPRTTKKPPKRPKHCFSRQKRATKKPRKSHEKVTSKNATSNEKSSENGVFETNASKQLHLVSPTRSLSGTGLQTLTPRACNAMIPEENLKRTSEFKSRAEFSHEQSIFDAPLNATHPIGNMTSRQRHAVENAIPPFLAHPLVL